MTKRMKDKYDKYWGNWHEKGNEEEKGKGKEKEKENINLLIIVAIEDMFGEEKGKKVWDAVNACLCELFKEYRRQFAQVPLKSDGRGEISDSEVPQKGKEGRNMKSRIDKKMRVGVASGVISSTIKSELEKYLSEDNENDDSKFDILAWWKTNSSRFPIFARLARDMLAIPISTVASESAFSTGACVLDDFQTSLTLFMVQALVCTQDLLRRSTSITIEKNAEELATLEEEYELGGSSSSKSNFKSQASKSITMPTPSTT